MSFFKSNSGRLTGSSPSNDTTRQQVINRVESVLTYSHVLCEGHLALLFNQFLGLESVVKVKLNFLESFEHSSFVIDCLLAKLFLQVFLLVALTLNNVLVTVF